MRFSNRALVVAVKACIIGIGASLRAQLLMLFDIQICLSVARANLPNAVFMGATRDVQIEIYRCGVNCLRRFPVDEYRQSRGWRPRCLRYPCWSKNGEQLSFSTRSERRLCEEARLNLA